MKINHTLRAVLLAAITTVPLSIVSAEDAKPPGKEVKVEEKKDAVKPYKLDTCLVADEKLGEMGKPFVFIHEGQEIKLCCKKCKAKFDKDLALYLKKLE